MKLWPFAKKPEEVEALSPGCDLPAGVMLASPEDHDLVVEPQPPRGNRDASTTPEAFLPQVAAADLPTREIVAPFDIAYESQGMALPPIPQADALASSTQWTLDMDEPNTFSLNSGTLGGEALTPPPMDFELLPEHLNTSLATNLPDGWATAPMPDLIPPQANTSLVPPAFSPQDLALSPPTNAAENLGALSASPLPGSTWPQELGGMFASPSAPSVASPIAPESAIQQHSDGLGESFNEPPQASMMAEMLPPSSPELMQSFGVSAAWDLGPPPELNGNMALQKDFTNCKDDTDWLEPTAEAVSHFDLGSPPDSQTEMANLTPEIGPMPAMDSWSDGEETVSESADLNSSAAAYDLNHYEDPDAPTESFELEKQSEDLAPAGGLQAMADMLAKAIPYEAPPGPSIMAQHFDEEEASHLEIPYPAEATVAAEADPALASLQMAHFMATPPANATRTKTEEPAPPEEEPLPTLKGMDPLPVPKIMEALSAKFIARPNKPKSQPAPMPSEAKEGTHPSSLRPTEKEPDMTSHHLVEAAHLQNAKARTLSQAINNFEQEMLLNETRFVKQSINNLVDRYFAQQEPDNSW